MWDEYVSLPPWLMLLLRTNLVFRYDEGTAFMPVVSKKRQVPKHDKYEFMALDEDGYDLPPDW